MRPPALTHPSAAVFLGDCLDVLAEMPDNSVDAIVTDPPYGLEFMGKEWDSFGDRRQPGDPTFHEGSGPFARAKVRYGAAASYGNKHLGAMRAFQDWCEEWLVEAYRVLKPGGHLLAFGGTRTWHRLAVAVEDAGFEVRDSIAWLYGSGFPKSLDVSKAIDKAAGATRTEVVGKGWHTSSGTSTNAIGNFGEVYRPGDAAVGRDVLAPATPAAQQWQGWGTALKPAFEPIVVARKPLVGTVAANVLAHGTGALNIDGTRVGDDTSRGDRYGGKSPKGSGGTVSITGARDEPWEVHAGRWPANVLLDGDAAAELDAEVGETTYLPSGQFGTGGEAAGWVGKTGEVGRSVFGYGDRGGPSRYFPTFRYQAKAPTRERPTVVAEDGTKTAHPTVKPLALMRWLVRLVTPPGGTVLDTFAGSGATVEAAIEEGFYALGIEREESYLPLIQVRLDRAAAPVADPGQE